MKLIKKEYLMIFLILLLVIFILFIVFYYMYTTVLKKSSQDEETIDSENDVGIRYKDMIPYKVFDKVQQPLISSPEIMRKLPIQEQYGNYCGTYNLQSNSENACKSDTECAWNKYVPKKGNPTGWCGLNPEPSHSKYANQDSIIQPLISDNN
jgi:hypothetical protein